MDFAVLTDQRVKRKEDERIDKYLDLVGELKKIDKYLDLARELKKIEKYLDLARELKKIEKYLDLARELKKLQNKRVMVISTVVGTLGIVPKGLEKELEKLETRGGIKIIQTTALLISARILRSVLETWRNLLSLRLQWKTTS